MDCKFQVEFLIKLDMALGDSDGSDSDGGDSHGGTGTMSDQQDCGVKGMTNQTRRRLGDARCVPLASRRCRQGGGATWLARTPAQRGRDSPPWHRPGIARCLPLAFLRRYRPGTVDIWIEESTVFTGSATQCHGPVATDLEVDSDSYWARSRILYCLIDD